MKRIDARTVELTEQEQQVREQFDFLLDRGNGIKDAARAALALHKSVHAPRYPLWITAEFVEYLSDGTLVLINGNVEDNR